VVGHRTRDRKVASSTPGRDAIKSTRSTQPSIPPGYVNRVPACMAGVRRGAFTCVGWQVTLCDPIWQVASRSPEVEELSYIGLFFTFRSYKHDQSYSDSVNVRLVSGKRLLTHAVTYVPHLQQHQTTKMNIYYINMHLHEMPCVRLADLIMMIACKSLI